MFGSFVTCSWNFLAYSISFFYLQLQLFAYNGKVCLRSTITYCKQRSSTVSKKTITVSNNTSPFLIGEGGKVNVEIFMCFFCPLILTAATVSSRYLRCNHQILMSWELKLTLGYGWFVGQPSKIWAPCSRSSLVRGERTWAIAIQRF